MRTVFLLLVSLHGLIHLIGFVKGWGLREVKALTLPISKPMGLLWLSATLLLLLYAVLSATHARYAWWIGLTAAVVSQTLVVLFWKDAKWGTLPNLAILVVALVAAGSFMLKSAFERQVKSDFLTNNTYTTDLLTENDMAHLPIAVQKYLRYTQCVGQPKVKNFRAEFTGGMRSKAEAAYMPFRSVQYNFYQKPARYFFMEAAQMGIPATGLHIYQSETATFVVKMLNWFKVVDAKGDQMNQAETVTLFNDMCFIAPATLIDRRITWETIDDYTVKGIYQNGDIKVGAHLYFNEKGELVNFISEDRYDTDGKHYDSYPWATPASDYRMLNGYLLPGKAKLIYQKPEGDFTYGEMEFKNVQYNLSEIAD